jgi:hypothetical protein
MEVQFDVIMYLLFIFMRAMERKTQIVVCA